MFETLIFQFATLAGVAALVAALVNVLKTFGLPDGYAPQVSAWLSLIAFVALITLKIFQPAVDVSLLDSRAADLAQLIIYLLGFFVQMGLPAYFHSLYKYGSVPVLGASHSNQIAG